MGDGNDDSEWVVNDTPQFAAAWLLYLSGSACDNGIAQKVTHGTML